MGAVMVRCPETGTRHPHELLITQEDFASPRLSHVLARIPSAGGNDPKSWGAIPLEEKDGRGIAKPAFDPDQWLRDAQAQGGVHHIGEGTPLVRECSTLIGLRISGERPDYARMTSS